MNHLALYEGKIVSCSDYGTIKADLSYFSDNKVWDIDKAALELRIPSRGSNGPIKDFAIDRDYIYFACYTRKASPIYVGPVCDWRLDI